jgi:hypothetical protein
MENFIINYWFFSSLLLLVLSFIPNNSFIRNVASIIFLSFGVVAGLRGVDFNSDTINYTLHFEGYQNASAMDSWLLISGGWFEPGYSLIVLISSRIMSATEFIFYITVFTTLTLIYQFIRFKYHPAIINNIFSTMMLIAATTTIRHFIALSLIFLVSNLSFSHRPLILKFLICPPLVHFSTIPIVALLFLDKIKFLFYRKALFFLCVILLLASFNFDFVYFLIDKLIDRASQVTQSTGVRSLILLLLLFLILHSNGKIYINRLRLIHFVGICFAFVVFLGGWMGLSRFTSFFHIIFLVYIHHYCKFDRHGCATNMILLNLTSFFSVIFLFNSHSLV